MERALALQKHAKNFFPVRTQSPEISSFGNIFALSEVPNPLGIFGYLFF